jgi:hypothetical protein
VYQVTLIEKLAGLNERTDFFMQALGGGATMKLMVGGRLHQLFTLRREDYETRGAMWLEFDARQNEAEKLYVQTRVRSRLLGLLTHVKARREETEQEQAEGSGGEQE